MGMTNEEALALLESADGTVIEDDMITVQTETMEFNVYHDVVEFILEDNTTISFTHDDMDDIARGLDVYGFVSDGDDLIRSLEVTLEFDSDLYDAAAVLLGIN